jgi:lysozyme family protein
MVRYMDAIDRIIRRESSAYTNHPADRGGPTKYGITRNQLARFRGRACSEEDVRNLTEAEARRIYEREYCAPFAWITWARLREFAVNAAVQHGVGRAVKMLQEAAGVTVDGIIGEETKTAVNRRDTLMIFANFVELRARFYGDILQRDKSQLVFAAGWFHRLADDLSLS